LLLANKPELLMVIDRSEIPLHTIGVDNDILQRQPEDEGRKPQRRWARSRRWLPRIGQGLRQARCWHSRITWESRLSVPGRLVVLPLPQLVCFGGQLA
jgi:hypothetical protein